MIYKNIRDVKEMDKFWKQTMEILLGQVLYHGVAADEKSWVV